MDGVTILLIAVAYLVSLSLHESAHAWTAWRCGDDTGVMLGRVTLNPIPHIDPIGTILLPLVLGVASHGALVFGYAKPVPYNPYRMRNPQLGAAATAAAGPLSNFLIAVVAAVSLGLAARGGRVEGTLGLTFLLQLITLNVVLGLFNLMPVAPLDGGTVLAGLLPRNAARVWANVERLGPIPFILALVFLRPLLTPVIGGGVRILLDLADDVAGRPIWGPFATAVGGTLRTGATHG